MAQHREGVVEPEGERRTGLVGYEVETTRVERLVDRLPEGGDVLVIRGGPGMGKTSLLEVARHRAVWQGVTVLEAAGVQSEATLGFSGLHQLLWPIATRLKSLAEEQRDALAAALGMAESPVREPAIIAEAALSLLSGAAERSPLMLVADDAQWLDRSTLDVLANIAHRIGRRPIGLLVAERDGSSGVLNEPGIPEIRLVGLNRATSESLLDRLGAQLTPEQKAWVVHTAAGNPLALLELPRVLGPDLPAEAPVAEAVPLTSRLERAFAQQDVTLPDATRTLLLVAAADDRATADELVAAASRVANKPIGPDALEPASAVALATFDGNEVRFRHPVSRSAIYRAASAQQRRAAHAALALVLTAEPDRQVWHRAQASIGPDEPVAEELERFAARSELGGALSVAKRAWERAATLSVDGEAMRRRLLKAAGLAIDMGQADVAERLVGAAERAGAGAGQRARILWLRERASEATPADSRYVLSLAAAAVSSRADGDSALASELLLCAASRCWWGGAETDVLDTMVELVEAKALLAADPRAVAAIAFCAPIQRGAAVMAQLGALDGAAERHPQAGYFAGLAAHAVGHFGMAATLLGAAASRLRARGHRGLLCRALAIGAWDEVFTGDWATARAWAEEAAGLAGQIKQPMWSAAAELGLALLAGLRGDAAGAEQLVRQAEQVSVPRRLSALEGMASLARGVTALGDGRQADALRHLQRMFDPADPAFHQTSQLMGIGFLADAGLHAGRQGVVRALLADLEAIVAVTPSPGLRLGLAYSRAVLAEDGEAEALYRSAMTALVDWPFVRARLELAYGAWLRRRRRIADSRVPLRAAHDTFTALDARPWTERAGRELAASGEDLVPNGQRTVGQLTPQEMQIARLAAEGLSNREIAQELYLSPRTVSTHLYRLFQKLMVTSRSQLAGALSTGGNG